MPETLTEWQRVRAVAWYAKGLTVDDIATILGRSAIVVATALQLAGARSPSRVTKQRERDAQYREGFGAGYRLALAHAKIHGREAAHKHWKLGLLSWIRDGSDDIPPAFARSS